MLRQRQDQRLAVLGLGNGEGPRDKIHILPADPRRLAAPQPREEHQLIVIRQGGGEGKGLIVAQAAHGLEPGRQRLDANDGSTALGRIPGAGVGEPQHGVVPQDRVALAVL
jgi:hypothetical protein